MAGVVIHAPGSVDSDEALSLAYYLVPTVASVIKLFGVKFRQNLRIKLFLN